MYPYWSHSQYIMFTFTGKNIFSNQNIPQTLLHVCWIPKNQGTRQKKCQRKNKKKLTKTTAFMFIYISNHCQYTLQRGGIWPFTEESTTDLNSIMHVHLPIGHPSTIFHPKTIPARWEISRYFDCILQISRISPTLDYLYLFRHHLTIRTCHFHPNLVPAHWAAMSL